MSINMIKIKVKRCLIFTSRTFQPKAGLRKHFTCEAMGGI